MEIADLSLSDEIVRLLKYYGKMTTVEELVRCSDQHLLDVRGIGKKQLKYIRKALDFAKHSESMSFTKENFVLEIQKMIKDPFVIVKHELNELRTVLLELYRIVESMKLEKSPDGIVRMVNEKIPGFSAMIYDIYKKIEDKE